MPRGIKNSGLVRRPVNLNTSKEVFDFYYKFCDGKGHIVMMQQVLQNYMEDMMEKR